MCIRDRYKVELHFAQRFLSIFPQLNQHKLQIGPSYPSAHSPQQKVRDQYSAFFPPKQALQQGHLRKCELLSLQRQYPYLGIKSCPPQVQSIKSSSEQVLQLELTSKLYKFYSQVEQCQYSSEQSLISPNQHPSNLTVNKPVQSQYFNSQISQVDSNFSLLEVIFYKQIYPNLFSLNESLFQVFDKSLRIDLQIDSFAVYWLIKIQLQNSKLEQGIKVFNSSD
eukprot:TRINITY_DN14518_c0_g1_i3.p2 TRINITY_DN14518_c0_g1~~TRINITY_DN14518_c0_g1_i3.p2  ORF type:complete len:261 (-),score=1.99 TRINITY_DN14518_c0_g1_i3:39-707(-)